MRKILVLLGLCGLLCACSKETERPQITVYAAASLNEAISQIAKDFTAAEGVDVTLNFASSGALARQIMASPAADVFLSANERWMNEVEQAGAVVDGTRSDLLANNLVVIASKGADYALTEPAALPSLSFQYLVIGDPASVPAGQYAKAWLESVKTPDGATVWSAVEDRISPMPDVRAALMQVRQNAGLVGIVYQTDYFVAKDDLTLLYSVGEDETKPVRYSVAQIAGANEKIGADFMAYLRSPAATTVFEQYGFTPITGD